MLIQHLLLDLDETIYPASSQLWPAIRNRIDEYLITYTGILPEEVEKERKRLYSTYGTTLRGLSLEKEVDVEMYLDFVHDVPVEELIIRDQSLISTFEKIECKKHIFTNASRKHVDRVLTTLGISGFFSELITIEMMYPWCKPQEEAFYIALKRIDVTDNSTCLFIDDSQNNIDTGKKLGLQTVLLSTSKESKSADHTINRIDQVLPIIKNLNRTGS